jgi:hypothetical protein
VNNTELAIRVNPGNPNHHLWRNNGTWFVHYTVYPDAWTAERVRSSLRTKCLETARRRRDELFQRLGRSGAPDGLGCRGAAGSETTATEPTARQRGTW